MSSTRPASPSSTLEQIEAEFEALTQWIRKKCKESTAFRYFIGAVKGGAPAVGSVLGGAALIGLSLSGVGVILVAIGAFIGATIWKSRKILKEIKAAEDSEAKEKLLKEVASLNTTVATLERNLRYLKEGHEKLLSDNPKLNPNSIDNTVGGKKVILGTVQKGAPGWDAYRPPNDLDVENNDENSSLLSPKPVGNPQVNLHYAPNTFKSPQEAPSKKDHLISQSTEAIKTALEKELDSKMIELTKNEADRKQSLTKQATTKKSDSKSYATFSDNDNDADDKLVAAFASLTTTAQTKTNTDSTTEPPQGEKSALLVYR